MAQDFKRYSKPAVGTSPATVHTSNSNDALVGISISNILGSTILVDCYMTGGTGGSETVYLVKTAPIPSGGALQVLAGGAKFNMQSGDAILVKSDTASSADVWVSAVDAIS
jgi:hypothetical protein|tara:strand:+ start:2442 stop:2774 length:333 start_codon:yes stop_codon:yes gene_type:complete